MPAAVFSAHMEECWARLRDGQMRYLVGGSGPPLVLVHGIAASSFSFRLNCEELAQHFRLFLPDIFSVRSASKSGVKGSVQESARRIRELLDAVGLECAHFLGSSYGGAVVMELASAAAERFDSMILVSPANPFARRYHRVVRFYLSAPGGIFIRVVPYLPAWAWNYGIGRMYAEPAQMASGTGAGYARPLRRPGAVGQVVSCIHTLNAEVEALRAKLPLIAGVPSLLIWGDRDPVVELESAYPLQKELGADMAVMRGVGHLPYEERPQEFNQIVKNFVIG